MQFWYLGREDLLKEEIATHSSILAWKIPWTEEPAGYSSRGRKSQTRLSAGATTYTLVNMLTIIVTVLQCRAWGISPHWDSSLSVILWWKKESWTLKQGKGTSLSLSLSLSLFLCVCVCVCVWLREMGHWALGEITRDVLFVGHK